MEKSPQFTYPVQPQVQEDGRVLVTFPDIPEALTDGATQAEALHESVDCLIAALGGYVNDHRAIPRPSPARGRHLVRLPALVAAKLALYQAMRKQEVSIAALAERIGRSEGSVQRLLDLDHHSHIGHIEAALNVLGRRLVVATQAA